MNSLNFTETVSGLTLSSYNSDAYGPLFAVSDEGSAGEVIVEAAYSSAKARALAPIDPLRLGVALDGERMTSAGEVPIGPEEYEVLNAAASGRLFLTTNVGVRVNARLNQQLPEFPASAAAASGTGFVDAVASAFAPFLRTPDGRPRPLTVRLSLRPDESPDALKLAVEKLEAARAAGKIGPSGLHRLSALLVFPGEIGAGDLQMAEAVIDSAARAGLKEVALDADLREAARRRLGIQSLLNILDVKGLQRLLDKARQSGVRLAYRYQLDVESAARTIWTGLHTARGNGFSAGKYGMTPMTLEEQAGVVESITRWTAGWTAIPAFYVDTPLLTATEVFDTDRCEEAALVWLKMARGGGARIVLFDAPDRVSPRRLVRPPGVENDPGVLTIEAIARIDRYARELGVSVLWSGGIAARQAFQLAQLRVGGIFSTSSTAGKIAVTAEFERDPRLPAENEPTDFGVRRIHAIIQGGFLCAALRGRDAALASSLEARVGRLLDAEQDVARAAAELAGLDAELIQGWQLLHPAEAARTPAPACLDADPRPVAADAVRVFRGRKRASVARPEFLAKLGATFMPMTVQMQRLYGLTAYLPAVPPASDNPALPDELALVFYRTQAAYQEAKRCVGGRAYGDLHDLVFDMPASGSGFPELFAGQVKFDAPYHLFVRSVDWQSGSTRIYLGARLPQVSPEAFAAGIAAAAAGLQQSPGPVDAVIFCAGSGWLAWWEHTPEPSERAFGFDALATTIYSATARRLRMPPSLTRPYGGIALSDRGDFVNFQFPRL